jgi:hypothetical protein
MRFKWATIALVAALFATTLSAQSLISEDFSSGVSTTPPTGWSNSSYSTGGSTCLWRFNNPAARTVFAPFSGQFAINDTDFNGPGTNMMAILRSPAFNASAGMVNLVWDHMIWDLTTECWVEVNDGSTWNQVYYNSGISVGYPSAAVSEGFDITAAAGGSSAAQVRFRTQAEWDWYWAVDNVGVFIPAPTPGQAPRAGLSAFDINSAAKNVNQSGVPNGNGGPYYVNVSQGGAFNLSFEGGPNQAIAVLYGALNPVSATYPAPIGQFDIGGPGVDGMGLPLNIGIFADAISYAGNPVGFPVDAMFFTGAAGTVTVGFTFPNFGIPSGAILTTFQAALTNALGIHISNCIQTTIN